MMPDRGPANSCYSDAYAELWHARLSGRSVPVYATERPESSRARAPQAAACRARVQLRLQHRPRVFAVGRTDQQVRESQAQQLVLVAATVHIDVRQQAAVLVARFHI